MPNLNKWADNFEQKPGLTALKALLLLVVIVAVVGAAIFGVRALFFAPQQAAKIVERTFDGDNILYNYEWFHDTYEDVKAIDRKIGVADTNVASFEDSAGPRTDWTFEDKTEYGRLRSVLQGLESQRADIVADYNAKSKMANREIFKDGRLPDRIE